MKYGQLVEDVVRKRDGVAQSKKAGKAFEQEPLLDEYEEDLWHAFAILHRSRTIGFSSPNPIAVSEMLAYARGFVFDAEEFVGLISALDRFWCDWHRDRGEGDNAVPAYGR